MNHLARERSPYLLQHADNPVDWFAWGEEAFAKARADSKPIFLSIGYSTCHWCHVMAHESFENDAVAAVLNEHFVSIKVDREERPDVDRVYMTFVQATTGSGGWPMSVWLTPDLKPFYGGTYFPPSSRWGRPGFVDVLEEVARAWKGDRAKVVQSADALIGRLQQIDRTEAAEEMAGEDALAATVTQFREVFDQRHGGFGDAPKFPRPSELLFLFREHARAAGRGDPGAPGLNDARDMSLRTLQAMALGGVRDHIGGGFHRYSVDAGWRVPHFEKMLYDQAQLALAYLEGAQVSGDPFYAEVAEDTLLYVSREMTDPEGGFYSAEDADSVPVEQAADAHPHKAEGAFYLWRAGEIDALLGEDAAIFKRRFGIEPEGNAPVDPQEEFTGKNLLYVARSVGDLAQEFGQTPAGIFEMLNRTRLRLFEARVGRPRPHLDDKVLTAWNGLMIGAFARGSRVLRATGPADHDAGEPFLEAARQAAAFIRDRLWDPAARNLKRRYRGGDAAIDAYAEDYACLVFGLLELFQADADPQWLEWAITLQRRQDELFWDEAGGGWFSTTGTDASVLLRMKEDYDGAEPTASSVSVVNLLVLSHLTVDPAWSERIDRTLRAFGGRLERMGRAVPLMAAALSMRLAGLQQIAIIGGAGRDELEREAARHYLPFAVTVNASGAQQRNLASLLPFVGAMTEVDGRAAAYVCRDFTCRRPATTAAALARELGGADA